MSTIKHKKVLLIVVDALASRVFLPALENGQLPHFKALAEAGVLRPMSSTIFPSVTPAATASIVTGSYPAQHGVLGFHWYDREAEEVIYYGDDFWMIWGKGFGEFFSDFLVKLNRQRLKATTLFQTIERTGRKAASLNYLIFRGDVRHQADVPLPLSLIPGVPFSEEVSGPSIMYFGDLVDSEIEIIGDSLSTTGGLFRRFGFDDDNTAHLLRQLIEGQALPDFTLAYFPNNDYDSHDVGPAAAAKTLEALDAQLGKLFEAFGGLEQMLAEICLIITGDHSQSDTLADATTVGIRLDDILGDFAIAAPGQPWSGDDQLVLCPDMRTAKIYFRHLKAMSFEGLTKSLLADPRVDQLLWADNGGYCVATADRGQLCFWANDEGPHPAVDRYGNRWSWRGDLAVVDGRLSSTGLLTFGDYPNAFERLAGGLGSDVNNNVWVTARPGYEFQVAETNVHLSGGSHGSLHALDSLSPLLVAGAPAGINLPLYPRTVDIAPLCLAVLGLRTR